MLAGGVGIGALIGILLATRVQMTAMPELVAVFNGLGGAASVVRRPRRASSSSPDAGTVDGGAAD